MDLSIIIPIYNEEKRIRKSVISLNAYLEKQFKQYEIIAVNDGSSDGTKNILDDLLKIIPSLVMVQFNTNHGKGFAVRKGVEVAEGKLIAFTDADLSTPANEIKLFAEKLSGRSDLILIGSRVIRGANITIKQPFHRVLMGRIFNLAVRFLTKLPFSDTQCGFKMFPKEAGKKIFSKMKENGFVFDVEALMIAKRLGYQIAEVPIEWADNPDSKIRPIQDSVKMFQDLIKVSQINIASFQL